MSPAQLRKFSTNLHSSRLTAPSLERLLAVISGASSAADLDAALRAARAHYAGSMMEQIERAGAQRADYLLNSMEPEAGDA